MFGAGVVAQTVLSGGANGRYIAINIAWGLAVTLGVYAAGGVSGAHLNPAVTLALAVHRGFAWRKVLPYAAAQTAGAFAAAAVVYADLSRRLHHFDGGVRQVTGPQATAGIFATYPQEFLTLTGGLVDQVAGTAILVALIFAIIDPRNVAAARLAGTDPLRRAGGRHRHVLRLQRRLRDQPRPRPRAAAVHLRGGLGRRGLPRRKRLVVGADRRAAGGRPAGRLALRRVHRAPPPRGAPAEGGRMSGRFVLALDQGTTSSRAIVFGHDGRVVASAQQEFPQILPAPGHVEHDPGGDLVARSSTVARAGAGRRRKLGAADIAAIGITNQRETTILWERDTGKPVANAIVWQSRISAPICERLKSRRARAAVPRARPAWCSTPTSPARRSSTCSTRIAGLRARAEAGEILFGTVDSFLIWRLTGGQRHVTDVSNASRTLLFNIHTLDWDDELLQILDVPRAMLPEVRAVERGLRRDATRRCSAAPIPIAGDAGDQQAATFGQACFEPGSAKNTYGTGCFMLLNTGEQAASRRRTSLLTTIGWQLGGKIDVLPGRLGVHRRRGRAVAARRPGRSRSSADVEAAGRERPRLRRRVPRAGVRRPRRAALGPVRPRRDLRPHARHDRRPHRPRGGRVDGLPDRATCSTRCRATPASRWPR